MMGYRNSLSDYKINLDKILKIIKKNLIGLFLWTMAGIIIALVAIFFIVTPKYSATVDLLVNQKAENLQAQYTMQQADLQAINTYKDVLKKPVILESVLQQAKEKDNYSGNLKSLQKAVSVKNEVNSQVISVSVVEKNPYVAKDIANMIGDTFTKKIKKMMKIDNVTVVGKAVANTEPVSPNKKLYVSLGALIGFMLGFTIALLRDLFDVTVKEPEFLEELGLINLGMVYHINNDHRDRSYRVVEIVEDEDSNSDMYRRV